MYTSKKFMFLSITVLFISFAGYPQADISPVIPQVILSPEDPTTADEVSLSIILGVHNNSCVPQYDTDYTLDSVHVFCVVPPCPPLYEIDLSYTVRAAEQDPSQACLDVITSYGPSWNFGYLNASEYTVTHEEDTIIVFTVTEAPDVSVYSAGREMANNRQTPQAFISDGKIKLRLQKSDKITVELLSMDGRLIERPMDNRRIKAGVHGIVKVSDLPAGVFFIRMITDGKRFHRRIVIAR